MAMSRRGVLGLIGGGVVLAATRAAAQESPTRAMAHDAAGGGRAVALVIGNAAYGGSDRLQNAVWDAKGIELALRELQFEVFADHDLDKDGMIALIDRFTAAAAGAAVAVVYYSGHALQETRRQGDVGENFLLPVNLTQPLFLADLWGGAPTYDPLGGVAVPLSYVLKRLAPVPGSERSRINLVYLDACRTSGFERSLRGSAEARGLAAVAVPDDTLLDFATRPGEGAFDRWSSEGDRCPGCGVRGAHTHSPFTAALLARIRTPGLEVHELSVQVRQEVYRRTGGRQMPQGVSALRSPYWFVLDDTAPKTHPGEVLGVTMVPIAAGTARLGCVAGVDDQHGQPCGSDEAGPYGVRVEIAAFELARGELSRGVWRKVVAWGRAQALPEAANLPVPTGDVPDDRPMTGISWVDCVLWCRVATAWTNAHLPSGVARLWQAYTVDGLGVDSGRAIVAGVTWEEAPRGFQPGWRLPTEFEWEFAARGPEGTSRTMYAGFSDPSEACAHANIDTRDGWGCDDDGYPAETLAPAELPRTDHRALSHLTGNVGEWTWTRYDSLGGGDERTADVESGAYRVLRGGSWVSGPRFARVANRYHFLPVVRYSYVGVRLARSTPGP